MRPPPPSPPLHPATRNCSCRGSRIFAARPPEAATLKRFSSNKHNISASDGPLWRLLRRNLSLQILHPSKIKSFSPARKWVLEQIKGSIKTESKSGKNPADHFQFGGRKLTEDEIVTLCSEFFTAGAGTTSTALQWVMANLVKHQDIQSKLYDEIRKISDDDEIKEEDLKELPYQDTSLRATTKSR
ncbi:cytochrome P450 89A2-like [Papaver somniferum]|uniref:cytochrome P450 89A2-like n=1 Tax=Papaver somniferum TaxID=3469 RepID=UPI000E6F9DFA|nr:cytochrome P450 89A2-like [Papaver somniferum]